ncbi:MAG: helix-hairpin-helix protein [Syntrophaceae bacterium]|nr:MAG: helix-hairpin-helix protein [Syntrophaceae bacterium]
MLKKSSFVILKNYSFISFALMMCAVFILGIGATPVQAAKKADVQKGVAALVDINSATQQELEAIKGVGPATAKKIIAGRPYKSVDELSKAGLSAKAVEAMKLLVTVGKAKTAPVTAAAAIATSAITEKKAEAQKNITAGLIDINNASEKELEAVKGVGPATAKKIVAGRPYKSVDELSKAGISAKAIEAMKPFVTTGKAQASSVTAAAAKAAAPVSAAAIDVTKATKDVKATAKSTSAAAAKLAPGTKININTADQATLEKLPEIGPVKAKAIIDGRPYKTIEDVMKVSGIKGKTFDVIKDFIVVK